MLAKLMTTAIDVVIVTRKEGRAALISADPPFRRTVLLLMILCKDTPIGIDSAAFLITEPLVVYSLLKLCTALGTLLYA